MTESVTVKPVYEALRQYVSNCPDVGMRKALLDGLLEPANPFDQRVARQPKPWFVLFSLLVVTVFSCFIYFNNPW